MGIREQMMGVIHARQQEIWRAEKLSTESLDAELQSMIESDLDDALDGLGLPQPRGE